MHGLNGKLTALRCFISKSAKKAMPLFQTLKGCVDKNNFRWTVEAKKELEKLKEALKTLQTPPHLIPGETISVYLATSLEAISVVLTVERE